MQASPGAGRRAFFVVADMAACGGPVELARAIRAGRNIILTLGEEAPRANLMWRRAKIRLET